MPTTADLAALGCAPRSRRPSGIGIRQRSPCVESRGANYLVDTHRYPTTIRYKEKTREDCNEVLQVLQVLRDQRLLESAVDLPPFVPDAKLRHLLRHIALAPFEVDPPLQARQEGTDLGLGEFPRKTSRTLSSAAQQRLLAAPCPRSCLVQCSASMPSTSPPSLSRPGAQEGSSGNNLSRDLSGLQSRLSLPEPVRH